MSNNVKGSDPIKEIWRRVQERRIPVVAVVLLASLFIALAGFPWIWLIGGAIALALLLPLLFSSATGSAVTLPGLSAAQGGGTNPDLSRLSGHYLQLMQHTLSTRRQIEEAIAQTQDPGQRHVLTDSVRDLPALTEGIYSLALKAQSVNSGIGETNSIDQLTGEIQRLEATIKGTNDEFQKSQYYAALDGKLQQMQNITDTTVALRRWDAQVENAVSTLDTLLSQVLRIKSSEVLSYTGATDDMSNALKREVDSLKAASEAMDTVYGWQTKT